MKPKQINTGNRKYVIHAQFINLIENVLSTTYTILTYARKTQEILKNGSLFLQIFLKLYNDPSPYTKDCSLYPAFSLPPLNKKKTRLPAPQEALSVWTAHFKKKQPKNKSFIAK